ncbi:TetR/AcrR family transcriptional regulator, partial [Streptomyces rubrogriseus]|nr:TetR/AcrR family transcriptional regulator [Streptomyces rubrogriseus]
MSAHTAPPGPSAGASRAGLVADAALALL